MLVPFKTQQTRPESAAQQTVGLPSTKPWTWPRNSGMRVTVFILHNSSHIPRVKGRDFDIPNLLNVSADSETAKSFAGSSLAIFRLAPADYHRFHSPIDGEVGEIVHIPGQYYTGTHFTLFACHQC